MLRIMFMGFQKTNLWGRLGTRLLTPNEHQSLLRRAVGLFLKLMWNEGADMECVRPNDNHALQSSRITMPLEVMVKALLTVLSGAFPKRQSSIEKRCRVIPGRGPPWLDFPSSLPPSFTFLPSLPPSFLTFFLYRNNLHRKGRLPM